MSKKKANRLNSIMLYPTLHKTGKFNKFSNTKPFNLKPEGMLDCTVYITDGVMIKGGLCMTDPLVSNRSSPLSFDNWLKKMQPRIRRKIT